MGSARPGTRPRCRLRPRPGPEYADDGGTPAAAASAATIPKASGKIDGTTATSQSGSRCTRWRCSSAPVKSVPGGAQRLELVAVVAEADDQRARIEPASASSSSCTPLFSISFPK